MHKNSWILYKLIFWLRQKYVVIFKKGCISINAAFEENGTKKTDIAQKCQISINTSPS